MRTNRGPESQLGTHISLKEKKIIGAKTWRIFVKAHSLSTVSLLHAHLPYTLAQRGALRVGDAIDTITELRRILDDSRFTESPCQAYRDQEKVEQTRQKLDGLLEQMQTAAKQLTFEGVFINDPRCKTF